ncbi:hypothetical protein E2C01_043172 [Portunus trituberculatus]|uniref:Uncharacterized protein n=1 Tax=Portunus trituberculatus TaxID=210409 RepID=A0A5B7FWK2_PORTR|nr:hypothetical protein [Portunus trituberculatus]
MDEDERKNNLEKEEDQDENEEEEEEEEEEEGNAGEAIGWIREDGGDGKKIVIKGRARGGCGEEARQMEMYFVTMRRGRWLVVVGSDGEEDLERKT